MEDKNAKGSDSSQQKYKRKNHSANESKRIQENSSFEADNEHSSLNQTNSSTERENQEDQKQDERKAESFQ